MELGELVSVVTAVDEWECPFPHRPREHNQKNVLPPPSTKNNAKKLSANLDEESMHLEPIPIVLPGTKNKGHEAQFTAHHLIPGNETWPESDLYEWIDKRKKLVQGDIGYDVNAAINGIDLPSSKAISGWGSKSGTFQRDYAFASMAADKKTRQFHDRHPAYSEFVVKVTNKIAAKLEAKEKPGCGKKNCGAGVSKPYAPPYGLLARLVGLGNRLRGYLWGGARNWRKPIMTSRFALMYKNKKTGMLQDAARAELKTDQFAY